MILTSCNRYCTVRYYNKLYVCTTLLYLHSVFEKCSIFFIATPKCSSRVVWKKEVYIAYIFYSNLTMKNNCWLAHDYWLSLWFSVLLLLAWQKNNVLSWILEIERERERCGDLFLTDGWYVLCICKVTDEKNAPCVCQDLMCHVICTSNVCVDLVEIIQYFYSLILGVWFYNLQFTKHFKEKVLVRNNVKKITNQYTCNQYKVYSICTQSTEMKYCVYRISVCMV